LTFVDRYAIVDLDSFRLEVHLQASLDKLDYDIIACLRQDGRQANTEIARQLSVSESTVRTRIQRLIADGIIQIAAITALPALGYSVDVLIGVDCSPDCVTSIAGDLSTQPEIRYVVALAGRFDILVAAFFRSHDELFDFLTEKVGKIPGVRRVETFPVLRTFKRGYDYWPGPISVGPNGGI
jgi:Lrp/AsnC family transcriptional regulator, regulator for asnA, asnC and gidA